MFRIKVHDDFEVILIIKGVFWNMPTHPNFICSLKYQAIEELAIAMNINLIQLKPIRKIFQ